MLESLGLDFIINIIHYLRYNASPILKKSNNQACTERGDANCSKKTIAAAAAIQKLKCLQIADQDKINNSWDLDLDKINYFTISQPAGE